MKVFPPVPGHFPGDPVVPGAVLLEWVVDELAARGIVVTRIERVRFLNVVRPGDELELRGTLRFGVWRGEEEVVRGVISAVPPTWSLGRRRS